MSCPGLKLCFCRLAMAGSFSMGFAAASPHGLVGVVRQALLFGGAFWYFDSPWKIRAVGFAGKVEIRVGDDRFRIGDKWPPNRFRNQIGDESVTNRFRIGSGPVQNRSVSEVIPKRFSTDSEVISFGRFSRGWLLKSCVNPHLQSDESRTSLPNFPSQPFQRSRRQTLLEKRCFLALFLWAWNRITGNKTKNIAWFWRAGIFRVTVGV